MNRNDTLSDLEQKLSLEEFFRAIRSFSCISIPGSLLC